jgi:hypothetical protein
MEVIIGADYAKKECVISAHIKNALRVAIIYAIDILIKKSGAADAEPFHQNVMMPTGIIFITMKRINIFDLLSSLCALYGLICKTFL